MNRPLIEKQFIDPKNFRNIYQIWYKGFRNIFLEQCYNIATFGSICILCSCLFPFMVIPCLLFWLFQIAYIGYYIYQLNELRKLDIYHDSWEETIFNLLDLQDEYQFCRIKPILSEGDIKEYILFYDKYLSAMIQNKTIPFPNLIYARIYHYMIIDYFLPNGQKKERSEMETRKRFMVFSVFYIVLFPVSILLVAWHLLRYFELFYGKIKQYRWSNYAMYYYREKNEYPHEIMERLKHLDENAYNLVHHNDKPFVYTFVRIVGFVSANILFYCTILILVEDNIILVRWIGILGLIITFCQKWMSRRVDNVDRDITILSSHLDDYNVSKKRFSMMYINNLNYVVHEIISFFQIIWYFLRIYPNYHQNLKQFFDSSEFYWPVGNIKM